MIESVKTVKQKNRGGFFKRIIRESLILSYLNKLSDRIYKLFSDGILHVVFTGSDETDKLIKNGLIGSFLSKLRIGDRFIRPFKVFFASKIEKSRVTAIYRRFIESALSLSIRSLGIFILTLGVYGSGIYIAKLLSYITLPPNESDFFLSAFLIITGIPMLFSGKSVADALRTSTFFNRIFIGLLSVNEITVKSSGKSSTYGTGAFILGTVSGLSTIFISPYVIVYALLIFIGCCLLVYMPEFGLLSVILLFPLISVRALSVILIVTAVSFLLKVMRGKRNLVFRATDIFILIFTLFVISVGLTSTTQIRAMYLVCFISAYFMISNLIVSRRLIKQSLYCLYAGAAAGCILYIFRHIVGLSGNNAVSVFHAALDSSLVSRESFGYFLILILPVVMAMFRVNNGRTEKASMLVLISLIFACVIIMADARILYFAYAVVFVYFLLSSKKIITTLLNFSILTLILYFAAPHLTFISGIFTHSGSALLKSEVNILIKNAFLNGAGMGDANLKFALNSLGASNYIGSISLFQRLLAEGGVFFLISFLLPVFFILQKAFYCILKCGKFKMDVVSAALSAAVVMFLFCSLFYDLWKDIRVYMLFWIICGMISAIRNVYGRDVFLKEATKTE